MNARQNGRGLLTDMRGEDGEEDQPGVVLAAYGQPEGNASQDVSAGLASLDDIHCGEHHQADEKHGVDIGGDEFAEPHPGVDDGSECASQQGQTPSALEAFARGDDHTHGPHAGNHR